MYKILIVDDKQGITSSCKQIVERRFREHVSVYVASNGKTALDYVIANEPRLVLMDIVMPVMDGIQATKEMRANHYIKPILLWSTDLNKETELEAQQSGATEVLRKDVYTGFDICIVLEKYLGKPTEE